MSEYKEYSKDIWDYLGDMPYMPSRLDRDRLLHSEDIGRVQIWDYFFRINPDDVGKPQKDEINVIEQDILEEISKYKQRQMEIKDSIEANKKALIWKQIKNFLYGGGCFVIAVLVYNFLVSNKFNINWVIGCASPFLILATLIWLAISIVGWDEKREIRALKKQSVVLHDMHNIKVKERVERKNFLKSEIRDLKKQIPNYPVDSDVYEWFVEHLNTVIEDSKRITGLLDDNLIDIESENPIPVFGPGELQNPERFPPTFTEINASDDINFDVKKHLTARRAFILPDGKVDVLYGIYYIECILIAKDMLATYGLFYDFVTGKSHAIETTEQYYKDVVSIVITNEFRWIEKIEDEQSDNKALYVEDAPTFILSLASGENRTVTFVNEKYFLEIKDKIDLQEENISKIFLIGASRIYANNAIRAIRQRLRLHKTLEKDAE